MADRRGAAFHDGHDLELVARAAAGDLAEREATAAHALLAACDRCAELAADLRAIAAATRRLPSASERVAAGSTRVPISGRDFRLTEADAARLRRRGILGIGRFGELLGRRSQGFGGALATLGLVGLLVAVGMPSLPGGAGGAATSLAPAGESLLQKEAATEAPPLGGAATAAPAAAPIPSDAYLLEATPDPALDSAAAGPESDTTAGSASDAQRAADGAGDDDAGASAGWAAVVLALVSAAVLVVGLNLLLAGRGRPARP